MKHDKSRQGSQVKCFETWTTGLAALMTGPATSLTTLVPVLTTGAAVRAALSTYGAALSYACA